MLCSHLTCCGFPWCRLCNYQLSFCFVICAARCPRVPSQFKLRPCRHQGFQYPMRQCTGGSGEEGCIFSVSCLLRTMKEGGGVWKCNFIRLRTLPFSSVEEYTRTHCSDFLVTCARHNILCRVHVLLASLFVGLMLCLLPRFTLWTLAWQLCLPLTGNTVPIRKIRVGPMMELLSTPAEMLTTVSVSEPFACTLHLCSTY